jgi:gamma-glutamylaminecyclotransferase
LATTIEKYALYVAGIPYVVPDEAVSPVTGEVYATNPRILAALDVLEGHPQYYYREKIRVRLDDGKELSAWIYFYPEKMGALVKEGDYQNWLQYQGLGQYF